MNIKNSLLEDLPEIFDLYKIGTEYMKSKNQVHWPEFPKDLIVNEIKENRQWKLIINDKIACVWATTLKDELIWGIKNNEPALYIHRIAANPSFRGQNLVKNIITWANQFGKENCLKYIRMDTVGFNSGLISHYEKLGFQFLGTTKLENTNGLPDHYNEGDVCLFQKEVS